MRNKNKETFIENNGGTIFFQRKRNKYTKSKMRYY